MPYSFDESEYEDSTASAFVGETFADDNEEGYLDEDRLEEDVESRLEAAVYLKTLLKGELFLGDRTAAARIVTKKVRDFVRTELRQLLGLEAPKQEASDVFTLEEVRALKAVAGKVLHKAPEPQLQTRQVAEAPAEPAGPVLRARSVAAPTRPAAPVAKPVAKQRPQAREVQPPKRGRPARKVVEEKETEDGHRIVSSKSSDGSLIREYFDKEGNKLSERNITPQVRPPGAIPMPSQQHMTLITEQQASATVHAQTQSLGALGGQLVQKVLQT